MPVLATLQRLSQEDARQFAYRILRASILELLLRPGKKLSEQEIAACLQMSRTPVRDVLSRLARENLVDLIPLRGAFVARIDAKRVEQAVWVQTQTGLAALDVLYTEMVPPRAFVGLEQNILHQEQLCHSTENALEAARLATEFQRILFEVANLDRAWSAMQCTNSDFWRLLYLGSNRAACRESTLLECRCIAHALATRDNAAACHALQHQFTRIHGLISSLREEQPDSFT